MKPHTQAEVDDYVKGYRTINLQPNQDYSEMFMKGYMEAKFINHLRGRKDIDWTKLPFLADRIGINE